MRFIRQTSARRLALLCAALVVLVAGGTALALAATSGGPVPPPKPLANAVHDAITAPAQPGVTARVSFKNGLLSGVDLRGSNPLLAGGDGRLWATNDGHFRLELQSSGGGGDAQIVSDGKSWWIYDGSSHTVYRGSVPQDQHSSKHHDPAPSVAAIQRELDKLMQHASVSGPRPGNTAGEPSYTVRTSPKRNGGLLGALALAWDANNGAPLRAAIYARGSSSPVLELKATDISFGPVDPSVFDVNPPAGAEPQNIAPPRSREHARQKLSFRVTAPRTLAGRQRANVKPLGNGDGALVTYGHGLSSIAVVQKTVKPGAKDGSPLGRTQLPTVSIGGTSAQELTTPLGTLLRFQRGKVMYLVAGSAPRAAVEAAARGL